MKHMTEEELIMSEPVYTTLNAIRENHPCEGGWKNLLSYLGKNKADDEPLALVEILKSNGIEDAIWCLRALPEEYEKKVRLFNCDVAEHVLPIFLAKHSGDTRPAKAISASRTFANGQNTRKELAAAGDAVDAAWDAGDAAWAAWAARDAAWAAGAAAGEARDAAWAARDAAGEARDAGAAAWEAEKKWQSDLFISYFGKSTDNSK